MAPSVMNPTTWDEYEGRASPSGSVDSTVLTEETALLDDGDENPAGSHRHGRRRYENASPSPAANAPMLLLGC